jgi:hypothetical protein
MAGKADMDRCRFAPTDDAWINKIKYGASGEICAMAAMARRPFADNYVQRIYCISSIARALRLEFKAPATGQEGSKL